MEFRVLGPVEVLAGDGPLPLGGPKQRAVLAHLILAAGRGVSAERLIDQVWGEEPPQAVKSSLESYVSRLRSAIGSAGRIESAAGTYRLRAEPDEVDLPRFETLLAEARGLAGEDPAAALLVFQEALALWRGRPFGDLADHPSFAPEVTRLEELRLGAIEDRLDVDPLLRCDQPNGLPFERERLELSSTDQPARPAGDLVQIGERSSPQTAVEFRVHRRASLASAAHSGNGASSWRSKTR